MTEKRLFLALDLPTTLASAIHAIAADTRSRAGAFLRVQPRFVEPSRMHMTLKFLGNVDASRVPALADAVHAIAARHAPIAAEEPMLDAFPRASHAHVLVLSFGDPAGAFASLSSDVETSLVALDFAREDRPFRPHVTIARCKHSTDVRPLTREPVSLSQGAFDRIVLYESHLGSTGPTYTALTSAKLSHVAR